MKRFLFDGMKKGDARKRDGVGEGDGGPQEEGYIPEDETLMMIFGGLATYGSKHQQKVTRREVYTTNRATPSYLKWSEASITFNHSDHPNYV